GARGGPGGAAGPGGPGARAAARGTGPHGAVRRAGRGVPPGRCGGRRLAGAGLSAARRDRLRDGGEVRPRAGASGGGGRGVLWAVDAVGRGGRESGEARLVSISPVTSAAVRELGLPVAAEATAYTAPGLVDALVRLAAAGG